MLTSLLAEGDKVFFASANNNDPSPDPSWRVRATSADLGMVAESEVVAKHPQSVSFGGMSLASQGGRRGGLFWDASHGCRFVAIGDDGAAGATNDIDPTSWCYGLVATASGYQAFLGPESTFMPLVLLSLDEKGDLQSKVDVFPSSDASSYPRGRALLSDGSYLLAFSKGKSYAATRIDPSGKVVVEPHTMVSLGDHESFAITSVGDHALAVWTSDHAPGDVLVANLDASGSPVNVAFVGHAKPPVASVAIREYGDGALVAWSDASDHSIQVARVGSEGELLSSAVEIDAPGVAFDLRVAPTNFGAVVGFAALGEGLTQVFATALPCVSE